MALESVTAAAYLLIGLNIASPVSDGVFIERVAQDSALAKAGLVSGDHVLAWKAVKHTSGQAEQGEITSVFDWMWLEMEYAPRGPLVLELVRGQNSLQLLVPEGRWDARIRPNLPAHLLDEYAQVTEAIARNSIPDAIHWYKKLLGEVDKDGEPGLLSWVWMKMGNCWKIEDKNEASAEAYQTAIKASVSKESESLLKELRCDLLAQSETPALGEKCYKDLIAERNRLWVDSIGAGRLRQLLGQLVGTHGRLSEQKEHTQAALETFQRLAPRSHLMLASLNDLGVVANQQGAPNAARQFYERALEISLALESAEDTARSLGNLATVLQTLGNQRLALEYLNRERAILDQISPHGLAVASNLHDIASILYEQGDFEAAEGLLHKALAIKRKLDPASLSLAKTLQNLGVVAETRRDYESGRAFSIEALRIRRSLAPGGLEEAHSLNNLGVSSEETGDYQQARRFHLQALAIREKQAPRQLGVAQSLHNLGWVEFKLGNPDRSKYLLQQALALREHLAPNGMDTARTLGALGEVELSIGELDTSEHLFVRELAIYSAISPGTVEEAESEYALGRLYLMRRKKRKEAALHLARAVDSLERQFLQLGGIPENRVVFMSEYRPMYHDFLRLLLEEKAETEAFDLLERSRAHAFLAMLAERDASLLAELPEQFKEVLEETATLLDSVQRQLAMATNRPW